MEETSKTVWECVKAIVEENIEKGTVKAEIENCRKQNGHVIISHRIPLHNGGKPMKTKFQKNLLPF